MLLLLRGGGVLRGHVAASVATHRSTTRLLVVGLLKGKCLSGFLGRVFVEGVSIGDVIVLVSAATASSEASAEASSVTASKAASEASTGVEVTASVLEATTVAALVPIVVISSVMMISAVEAATRAVVVSVVGCRLSFSASPESVVVVSGRPSAAVVISRPLRVVAAPVRERRLSVATTTILVSVAVGRPIVGTSVRAASPVIIVVAPWRSTIEAIS